MKPVLFAKRFVAGEDLSDAVKVAKSLNALGIRTTLDHLGENVTNRAKANIATNTYIKVLQRIKKEKLDSNISIKLSQVGLAIDEKLALQNTEKILKQAKSLRLVVEIDIESSKYLDATLGIFLKLSNKYPSTIQAVQSYMYRTSEDVSEIIKRNAKIRLVKGAYSESRDLAYQDMNQIKRNFKKILKLYSVKGRFVAIGTHDEELINYAKRLNMPKNRYEFEMLYGVRRDLQSQLAKEGYPVRIYIPYGDEWFPYFYRRIVERKENLIFAAKSIFGK